MKTISWSKSKLVLLGSVLFLSSFFFGGQANAALCFWTASGTPAVNYSSTTVWKDAGGTACDPAVNVLIFQGASSTTGIVFDVSTTTQAISFDSAYTGIANISSGITVTTTGGFTTQAGGGAGAFSILSGATLVVGTNLNVSSTASFNISGTIRLGGNLTVTSTLNSGAVSAFYFTSITAQTISGPGNITFSNLNINSGGNTVTLGSSVTTTGDITVASGNTFALGANNLVTDSSINNSGTITQSSAGTVTMTGNSKNVGGSGNTTFYNLTLNDLTSLAGNVTTTNNLTAVSNLTGLTPGVDYNLVVGGDLTSTSIIQLGTSYGHGHLTMTGNGKNINLGSSAMQLYAFTVANGATTTLVGSGKSLKVFATTTVNGILNVGDQTTLELAGSGSTALTGTGVTNTNTSTVLFNGASQVIPTSTYYNLTIGPSSGGTATFGGNVTSTNLTVNSSAVVLALASNSLVILGNFTVTAGAVTQTSGSVTMSGTGSLGGTGGTTLADLRITGTTTLAGDVTASTTVVSGVFNGGTETDMLTLTGAGTPLSISGTFNAATGTVYYTGISNVASTTYYNLASAGTQTLVGNATTTNGLLVTAGAFTQSSGTFVVSGNGNLQNSGGNLTLFNLNIATNTTFVGSVTTTNVLTVASGKIFDTTSGVSITLTGTGTPFVINGTLTPGSVNVIYSGATANIASTTYYDLTLNSSVSSSLIASTTVMHTLSIGAGVLYESHATDFLTLSGTGTPLSNSSAARISTTSQRINLKYSGAEVNVAGGTFYNLTIDSASSTLIGNITVPNILTVNSGKTLNGSSYTINLSVAGTPFALAGTFVASNSTVNYTGATAAIAATTFATLTLGTGTYTLAGVYVTTTVAMTNNGTLDVGNGRKVIISSGTFTNNATTTLNTSGQIVKAATGGFSGAPYISGTGNGTGNTFSIIITDPIANLLAGSVETSTVTITNSTNSDSESVVLTETAAGSGVFSGSIPFNIANAAASNSKIDVSGNGTLSLTGYTKPTPPTVYSVGTLSDVISASYTGSTYSTGGGTSGGGSSPSVPSATGAASVTSAQTNSQAITLNLSATNATQVAISEDPGFAGASWDTYTPTKSFTLSSGAGEKTIYVKFRSASGGVTATYKVNVTLKPDYVPSQVVTPAVSTSGEVVTPVVTAVAQFEVSNPDSKVVISPVKTLVYKPNSVVKYTYSYKNETTKTVKVKIVRSIVDANGKVITKVTGSASITKGKTFKFNASSPLSNKVAEGNYTVKVQVLDFKTGKLIDENSFDITVRKPAPVVKKPVVKKPAVKKAPVKTVAKPAVKK